MTSGESGDAVLASTACWTAVVRALEHARPDRLFEDPWAEALAGDAGSAWITSRTAESMLSLAVSRPTGRDVRHPSQLDRHGVEAVITKVRHGSGRRPKAGTPERTGRPFNSFITAQ